jgi:hypothetical protein
MESLVPLIYQGVIYVLNSYVTYSPKYNFLAANIIISTRSLTSVTVL